MSTVVKNAILVLVIMACLAICSLAMISLQGSWGELEKIIPKSDVDIISHRRLLLGDRSESWIVKIDPQLSSKIVENCNKLGENLATNKESKEWLFEARQLTSDAISNEFETPSFVAGVFFHSPSNRGPFVDVVISKSMDYVYFHLWDI